MLIVHGETFYINFYYSIFQFFVFEIEKKLKLSKIYRNFFSLSKPKEAYPPSFLSSLPFSKFWKHDFMYFGHKVIYWISTFFNVNCVMYVIYVENLVLRIVSHLFIVKGWEKYNLWGNVDNFKSNIYMKLLYLIRNYCAKCCNRCLN